jgi:hypothetical protein
MDSGQPRAAASGMTALSSFRAREASRPFVIPGLAKREPGIHNHHREYGFRTAACRGFRNDGVVVIPGLRSIPPFRHSGVRRSREPGIHNHHREYGFRTAACRGFRNDGVARGTAAKQSRASSFRDAPSGAGPESITTNVSMDSGQPRTAASGMTKARRMTVPR